MWCYKEDFGPALIHGSVAKIKTELPDSTETNENYEETYNDNYDENYDENYGEDTDKIDPLAEEFSVKNEIPDMESPETDIKHELIEDDDPEYKVRVHSGFKYNFSYFRKLKLILFMCLYMASKNAKRVETWRLHK